MKNMQDTVKKANELIGKSHVSMPKVTIPDVSEIGNTVTYMVAFLLPDTR
ncbi:unnamed protein product [Fructobacillus cardui]|nr:unnamed protein product [Fructobacillus cardui]CAK1241899.1 unnamed protein product [Fructobacillus cardui]